MKIHAGCIFNLGKVTISSSSTKQKPNSRLTTETELIRVDDKIARVNGAVNLQNNKDLKLN